MHKSEAVLAIKIVGRPSITETSSKPFSSARLMAHLLCVTSRAHYKLYGVKNTSIIIGLRPIMILCLTHRDHYVI